MGAAGARARSVEQRELTQWFFARSPSFPRICSRPSTELDRWPEKVRLMQRNWIGRSDGLLIRFMLDPATSPGW